MLINVLNKNRPRARILIEKKRTRRVQDRATARYSPYTSRALLTKVRNIREKHRKWAYLMRLSARRALSSVHGTSLVSQLLKEMNWDPETFKKRY
jgi:hypothetical protein